MTTYRKKLLLASDLIREVKLNDKLQSDDIKAKLEEIENQLQNLAFRIKF